ncbi:hypothetical protein N656DRAFT_603123 [Canariomyces notabilis]|uniref:Secreted protein n=1 Tax=Canariomyces notabilis TaxID=2074819 RepID=A0AAN6TGR2_9PEZI|nr:hypothetical protein N656DRAFT_603123 [Canariomyces arenarius]
MGCGRRAQAVLRWFHASAWLLLRLVLWRRCDSSCVSAGVYGVSLLGHGLSRNWWMGARWLRIPGHCISCARIGPGMRKQEQHFRTMAPSMLEWRARYPKLDVLKSVLCGWMGSLCCATQRPGFSRRSGVITSLE